MGVKLSKEGGGYDLYRIDKDGKRITFASTQDYKQKLSLKNCQAIERGYDLDELAEKACPDVISSAHSAFKAGFQKALELMGAMPQENETEWDVEKENEWDVEIEKENVMHDYNGNISLGAKFKLDADGCLILKLKSE